MHAYNPRRALVGFVVALLCVLGDVQRVDELGGKLLRLVHKSEDRKVSPGRTDSVERCDERDSRSLACSPCWGRAYPQSRRRRGGGETTKRVTRCVNVSCPGHQTNAVCNPLSLCFSPNHLEPNSDTYPRSVASRRIENTGRSGLSVNPLFRGVQSPLMQWRHSRVFTSHACPRTFAAVLCSWIPNPSNGKHYFPIFADASLSPSTINAIFSALTNQQSRVNESAPRQD
eukprot:194596-Prorocentrum_minimum.AAC.5